MVALMVPFNLAKAKTRECVTRIEVLHKLLSL